MEEKSLFGKFPIEEEKERFNKIMEKFIEVYPNFAYPFLLFNRQQTIDTIKDIKQKLTEIGV